MKNHLNWSILKPTCYEWRSFKLSTSMVWKSQPKYYDYLPNKQEWVWYSAVDKALSNEIENNCVQLIIFTYCLFEI